jgi:hypothetical protein
MLIRHDLPQLDLYFAGHPGDLYDHLRTSSIRGIHKSEAIFFFYITGYDKRRKKPFLCINMKMMEGDYDLHRVLRTGIQEIDEFMIISREDSVFESFALATDICQHLGIPVAFGNRSQKP